MLKSHIRQLFNISLLTTLFIVFITLPATAGVNDLFGKKEIDETERAETIERIEGIQEKLQLLQEKLRVLERRKAVKAAAKRAELAGDKDLPPVQINWLPVDETDIYPGEAGVYTYLLFNGALEDTAAVGALEDFILTIETLPANDIPDSMANRFLLPAEKPQSSVSLGRRPYDFNLNEAFLRRLGLQQLAQKGPILVSAKQPLDPYSNADLPVILAVSFGRQSPQRTLELAKAWHTHESNITTKENLQLSGLFWKLLDGAGPAQVTRDAGQILVSFPEQ